MRFVSKHMALALRATDGISGESSPTFVGNIVWGKAHRVVSRGGPWRRGRAQLVMPLCRQNGGGG
jgi:hypothetical protein